MSELEGLLAEQARYYRERAGEYEDWWFRRGRYDHGPETNARWFADAAEAQDALERFDPAGDIVELACGTGLWTQRLAPHAASVTAVDGSPEMLELCRARVNDPHVSYIQADLFAWSPTGHTTCAASASGSRTSPRSASMIFGRKSGAPLERKAGCSSSTACTPSRSRPSTTRSPARMRKPCSAGSPTAASTTSSSASTNPSRYGSDSPSSAGTPRTIESAASGLTTCSRAWAS